MNLSVKGQLKLAARAAFAVGAAYMLALPGQSLAQEADSEGEDDAVELERYVTTGSRLQRADIEGASPITVIDREDIDLSGEISVADLLRSTSLNSFGSFRQQSGSSAQGLATISLRGLGSERTLVLIDGKRAPKAPYAPTAVDLNAIPLAAVERIEILQDGASAIYGSDAIGGVVNVILRRDFEGVQVMYGEGYPSVEGGDTREGSLIMGIGGDRGNLVIGASFRDKDIIYSRDQREYTPPGASFFSNNYVTPADGFATVNPVPGGCSADDAFSLIPYEFSVTGERCAYDFTGTAANEASTDNRSLFAKGFYEISDDWSVYTTASVANAKSFGRYAPTPAIFFVPGDVSGIDHDGDGADDDVYIYHRFAALGNRDNYFDGNVYDILGGFEGSLGFVDLDFGARYNEYKNYDIGRNYAVLPIVESYAAAGLYDYINPLNNSEEVLNAMKATITRESTWETQEAWLTASADLFSMGGGMAGLALGIEYRSEDYFDQYDSLSEAGVIGGSAGNSAGARRSVRGYFAEMALPITSSLEATLAARYDDYSDYGSDTSPMVKLRWQPLDSVTFRASYSQGFRAPTLDIISQKPSFSAEAVLNDEASCINAGGEFENGGCSVNVQVNTTIIANPELESEKSDQYSFGIIVSPTDWISATVDYYSIEIEDTISYLSTSDLVTLQNRGEAIPPGLSLTRNPTTGALSEAVTGYANQGVLETSGINWEIVTTFDLGAYGDLRNTLVGAYVDEYSQDGSDIAGLLGVPEVRAALNNYYFIGDFAFAYNINYIGEQEEDGVKADAWITHDIQLNYTAPWDGTITLGALNVTEDDVPVYPYDGRPYNFYIYDAYGRIPYFRYTQRF